MNGIFWKIYYGVPAYIGDVYRFIRLPLICFLFLWIGGSIIAAGYTTVYAMKYHSARPIELLRLGLLSWASEAPQQPNTQSQRPQDLEVLKAASPVDIQDGRKVAVGFMIYLGVSCVVFLWLMPSVARYPGHRANQQIRRGL